MSNLRNALWIEFRKSFRSRAPLFLTAGLMILPAATAFMMFIYRDPEFARSLGLISAKAELIGGSADWPFCLSMLAQGIAAGGLMVFGMIATWVFGREFADGAVKDLLAVPVARTTIVLAKFIVVAAWSVALTALVAGVGLGLGAALRLPLGAPEVFAAGLGRMAAAAILTIAILAPTAFFASAGRGYLLPMGMLILSLIVGNVVAVLGWGEYFPWAIPMLTAQAAEGAAPGAASYVIVLLTCLAGMAATAAWWLRADQSR